MLNRKDFNLLYNIDENLKNQKIKFKTYDFPTNSQSSKPKFNNESVEVSLEDIHRLNPVYNSGTLTNCIVFWDDIAQYTTLGTLDLFKELVIDSYEEEKNIPESERFQFDYFPEQFFGRPNNLIDGERFIYIALDSTYSITQIKRFIKKFYKIILTKSPMSGIVPALGTSIHMIKRVIFVFKHKLEDYLIEKLKDDLYEYWDINQANKEIIILDLESWTEEEIYKEYAPSAVFTPKANITLPILIQLNIKNVDIFTHVKHNGLSPEFLGKYIMQMKMTIAPGFNRIYLYDDQIHIDQPDIYQEYSDYQDEYYKKSKEMKNEKI